MNKALVSRVERGHEKDLVATYHRAGRISAKQDSNITFLFPVFTAQHVRQYCFAVRDLNLFDIHYWRLRLFRSVGRVRYGFRH